MNIGVVIPCYNEAKRLNIEMYNSFIKENDNFTFCFVNDGSQDDTLEIIKRLHGSNIERVLIENLNFNQGKSEAVRAGLMKLADVDHLEYIGYMDADLATPLYELQNIRVLLIEKKKQVVFGSRIIHLGAKVKRKFLRFVLGRVFATIVSRWILQLPIYDTQCGFKFFSKSSLLPIIREPFKSKWFFDIHGNCLKWLSVQSAK